MADACHARPEQSFRRFGLNMVVKSRASFGEPCIEWLGDLAEGGDIGGHRPPWPFGLQAPCLVDDGGLLAFHVGRRPDPGLGQDVARAICVVQDHDAEALRLQAFALFLEPAACESRSSAAVAFDRSATGSSHLFISTSTGSPGLFSWVSLTVPSAAKPGSARARARAPPSPGFPTDGPGFRRPQIVRRWESGSGSAAHFDKESGQFRRHVPASPRWSCRRDRPRPDGAAPGSRRRGSRCRDRWRRPTRDLHADHRFQTPWRRPNSRGPG